MKIYIYIYIWKDIFYATTGKLICLEMYVKT